MRARDRKRGWKRRKRTELVPGGARSPFRTVALRPPTRTTGPANEPRRWRMSTARTASTAPPLPAGKRPPRTHSGRKQSPSRAGKRSRLFVRTARQLQLQLQLLQLQLRLRLRLQRHSHSRRGVRTHRTHRTHEARQYGCACACGAALERSPSECVSWPAASSLLRVGREASGCVREELSETCGCMCVCRIEEVMMRRRALLAPTRGPRPG